jgi:tetratricopeptide (TPR) repeat protein
LNNPQRLLEQSAKTAADVLRARGFCSAHAGLNTQAIDDLNTLTSQREGGTAENLIKLAQVLVRRAIESTTVETDLEMAVDVASEALSRQPSEDERFMSNYVLGMAEYHRGNLDEAKGFLDLALSLRKDDQRAQALAEMINAKGSIVDPAMQADFVARGFFAAVREEAETATARTGLGAIRLSRREMAGPGGGIN